jgi:hypothetical protein
MGLRAKMISFAAVPAMIYAAIEAEGLGKMESGGNGEVYWERSMMTGPKVKSGEERAVAHREALFHGVLQWRDLYAEATTVGIDSVDGAACHRVEMIPHEGQPETHYYAIESGLLRKTATKLATDMGVIPIETYLGDYQATDGILSPRHVRQVLMGMQEMIFTTDSVAYNVALPDSIFLLPPDVQALVDKQAAEVAEKEAAAPAEPVETQ